MSNIATLRKTVEQLRREVNIERIRISQAGADLRDYCEKNYHDDMLLTGNPPSGENVYKDKSKCAIL
jgi:hypothetical protein